MLRPIITTIILLISSAAHSRGLHGTVSEYGTGEPLPYATVTALPGNNTVLTDAEGRWYLELPDGSHRLIVTYIGWQADTLFVESPLSNPIHITLHKSSLLLGEVVITARESQGITSSSRIDREAMSHLQPTSFTDLLELLPGNISQTPDMGKANTITLRETGSISATGARTANGDDYAITSLGTMFMVDGAPVNTDANLQSVPSASSTDAEGRRTVVNRGVDMRTISTDNIESVEIVRGIPSAEYGNLTSGLVNIHRIRRATPFTARFKADEFSKLFSIGKGVAIGRQVINADAGYLDSRSDPRDSRENFKRINGSIRAHLVWGTPQSAIGTVWSIGADYTGSIDNVKPDPDLNYNKVDEYESSYHRWALTSDLRLTTGRLSWLEYVRLNANISYQRDRLERHKQVAPQRASVAPTSMNEGESIGQYLLQEYVADYISDGRPLSAFVKLSALGRRATGSVQHAYKAGIEYTTSKNYGAGQIYDLTRPLSASWTSRPRAFRDIPALNVLSGYIEESLQAPLGSGSIEVQAGVRSQSLVGLDSRYALSGRVYLDPRLNAVVSMPAIELAGRPLHLMVAAGYGLTTKMPTIDYLFPQAHYNDLIQLNYYNTTDPLRGSLVSLRTYINDRTNYDLKAARNSKWEVRFGADIGANRFTVTYFRESLRSGYRYSSVYGAYALRRYDATAITPGTVLKPTDILSLPFEDTSVLDGYRSPANGTRIDKQGIEYTITTARIKAIGTSLIINGAWLRSRYSNSMMLFTPVSDAVGGVAVSDRYVGLYATDDGRINEQFNTNFTFDTQIPRWELIFTTSIQCMWYVKTRRMRDCGIPTYYLSATDGQLHPYSQADQSDVMLQYLVRHFNEAAYATQTVPPAIYLNLKATKKIGRILQISAFVNRIVDYLPDYTSNGLTIRRTSGAYFGMEANLSF